MIKDYLEAGKFVWAVTGVLFIVLGITYIDEPLSFEKIIACLAVGFFMPLGVYSFNLVTDCGEDIINKRNSVVITGRKSSFQIMCFSFLCKGTAILASFFIGWASFTIVFTIAVISFLYSYGFGFGRFKEMFLLKNITIAMGWSMLLLVPAFAGNFPFEPVFLILVFFVFAHCVISSTISDLKDVEGDSKNNVKTLPTEIGLKRTLLALSLVNAAAFLAIIIGVLFFQLKPYLLILLPVSVDRQYAFWIIEKGAPVPYVYATIDNPTCAIIGLLGVVGKIIWL